jgi:hypothetical protein
VNGYVRGSSFVRSSPMAGRAAAGWASCTGLLAIGLMLPQTRGFRSDAVAPDARIPCPCQPRMLRTAATMDSAGICVISGPQEMRTEELIRSSVSPIALSTWLGSS